MQHVWSCLLVKLPFSISTERKTFIHY